MTGSMPLAGWVPPACKCSHSLTDHRLRSVFENVPGPCKVDGCGCQNFRDKDEEQAA